MVSKAVYAAPIVATVRSVLAFSVDGCALDPLVEHGKLAVNVVYKRRAVIQHGGLHILIPLHGQSERFREKAYRNISAALLLVRCGINSGGLDNLAGAVIGYG